MSDGPYKSLPLARHWKSLAARLENRAYSPEEAAEKMERALRRQWNKEVHPVVLGGLKSILGEQQGQLFDEGRHEQIELLRAEAPRSVFSNSLIDCAHDAINRGLVGDDALILAVHDAVVGGESRYRRQIEEHYLRKAGQNEALNIRERARQAMALVPLDPLCRQLAGLRVKHRRIALKHSGIDDGVKL